MTITANDRRKTYDGNGVATTFNGPRAFLPAHLSVLFGTNGAFTLVPPSQYTVRGLGLPETTLQFNVPPAAGLKILILRTVPLDQPTDITNQGAFLPEIHEDAFDYRVMQLQQLSDDSMQTVIDPVTGAFVWDAKGQRIIRVGDAVAEADALNLRTALTLIEQTQTGGVGVTPMLFLFQDDNGNGLADGVATDFPIPQATIDDPSMYDVYFEQVVNAGDFVGMRPGVDYTIIVGADPGDSVMRFAVAPAAGLRGFAVLRGYARPWAGDPPLTTTAMRRVLLPGDNLLVDGTYENALIICQSDDPTTITIRANTGSASADWRKGDFAPHFMVLQAGLGKVTLAIQSGGTLQPPAGFALETRAQGALISALAKQDDSWCAGGDLLRLATEPAKQVFRLIDRTVLLGTNIATGTGKDSFVLPYDLMLDEVAARGLYAGLAVAQATGAVLTVDVNVDGVSILATRLTFDNNERTTITAATPAVYSTAFLAANRIIPAGSEVTIDVDQVGTALAKGLAVYLRGARAS